MQDSKRRKACKGNTDYCFYVPTTVLAANVYLAYFDAAGEFISRETKSSGISFTTTTPEGTESVAFSVLAASYGGSVYNNDITMEVI